MEWLSVNISGGHIFWNGVMHGNHDHGDGGVVDISAVDAYFGVDVCTLIFLIRKSFSKNLENSNGHIP
jgi:hypothetical protein